MCILYIQQIYIYIYTYISKILLQIGRYNRDQTIKHNNNNDNLKW